MIRVQELRIGNLVEYKFTDKFDDRKEWWEVTEIDADDIHWLSKVDEKDEDFRPIPLTEEILLKCGFEKHSVTGWFMGKGRTITIDLKIGLIYINGNIVSKNKNLFRYLHQLQNLYFALTNEELTVNL